MRDARGNYCIPLIDNIESKFGKNCLVIYRENEGRYYLYTSHHPKCFLVYDEDDHFFIFNKKRYSVVEFKRILELLIFI